MQGRRCWLADRKTITLCCEHAAGSCPTDQEAIPLKAFELQENAPLFFYVLLATGLPQEENAQKGFIPSQDSQALSSVKNEEMS